MNLSTPKTTRGTESPMEDDLSAISKSPIPRNDRKRRASDDSSAEVFFFMLNILNTILKKKDSV